MHTATELIAALGGPSKVCDLLGYSRAGGLQRIHNWKTRGIPAKVRLDHPLLWLGAEAAASKLASTKPGKPGKTKNKRHRRAA